MRRFDPFRKMHEVPLEDFLTCYPLYYLACLVVPLLEAKQGQIRQEIARIVKESETSGDT